MPPSPIEDQDPPPPKSAPRPVRWSNPTLYTIVYAKRQSVPSTTSQFLPLLSSDPKARSMFDFTIRVEPGPDDPNPPRP